MHTDWAGKIFPLFCFGNRKQNNSLIFVENSKKNGREKGAMLRLIDQLSEFQGHHTNKGGHVVRRILLRLVLRNLLKDPQEGHQIRFLMLRQIQLLNQVEELHRVLESQ